jgi:hypothetical protein
MIPLRFITALLVTFMSSIFVQAQIEVLSNGTIKIGGTSSSRIQSNGITTLQSPFIFLENTNSSNPAKIRANTGLQLLVPSIALQNTSINSPISISSGKLNLNVSNIRIGNDSLGFRVYVEHYNAITNSSSLIGGGGSVVPTGPSEIYMTGLSLDHTYIGRSSMPITGVYAKYLYSLSGSIGVLSASDIRLKKNITKLPSVKNRIMSLNVVKYDFTKTLGGEDVSNDPSYKNKAGLLAQEVKDIFPDVVYYNPTDSFYALDYSALIPYLIKSDQEQQDVTALQQEMITSQQEIIDVLQDKVERQEQMIMELQERIASLQKQGAEKETSNKMHKLFQNAPNPFNQSTKIEYILSENANNAKLCIYDLNGKQLRCFVLNTAKGMSGIEIRASDLNAGIYLYTLIVDNMPVDTKRMLLTE